jgi:hypothetical protein
MTMRGTKYESSRLRPKESDWNLAGGGRSPAKSRTRSAGKRKEPPRRTDLSSSSSDDEWEEEEEEEEEDTSDEDAMLKLRKEKPPHERVLVEVQHLQDAFAKFCICPECEEPLAIDLLTVCITTSIEVKCNNPDCDFMVYEAGKCARTTIHQDDNFDRMTDYALNVLYVLGFISMGDAHTEAARLLGLCGLPNDTTMKSRSFTMIEERIGPFIRELGDEIIVENLVEEVRLTMMANNTLDYFPVWCSALTDDTVVLDPTRLPAIDASYDMAWQQKGSGHQYNSQSGHGSMFGSLNRRIIGLTIKSKLCNKCNVARKKNPQAAFGDHEGRCWKNHNCTSGAMELAGCLELVIEKFNKHHVIIKRLCCDDDSSIRTDCQWSNADYLAEEQQHDGASSGCKEGWEAQREATAKARQRKASCQCS